MELLYIGIDQIIMITIPQGAKDNNLDLHRFSRMSEAEFRWWFITGPITTIASIIANSRGGIDVSAEILEHIRKQDVLYLYGMR